VDVAICRLLRVREHAGVVLEDLGVTPTHRHRMTRNDVLNRVNPNQDLRNAAGAILATMPVRSLTATAEETTSGEITLTARTEGINRVDVLVDGQVVESFPVADGEARLTIHASFQGASRALRLEGFQHEQLVVSQRVRVPPASAPVPSPG
jgi:hypothetical protein